MAKVIYKDGTEVIVDSKSDPFTIARAESGMQRPLTECGETYEFMTREVHARLGIGIEYWDWMKSLKEIDMKFGEVEDKKEDEVIPLTTEEDGQPADQSE